MKQRDQLADIDFVKIDYATYLQKNNIKVTTEDLANYIKQHPVMFKAEESRNIGVVYFPSQPSAADDAATQKEINKLFSAGTDASGGTENFQNTKNDSMFVMANSDMPYNPQYLKPNQLPQTIQAQIPSAAIGQTFGPYKEQNFYVVSKLLDKRRLTLLYQDIFLLLLKEARRERVLQDPKNRLKTGGFYWRNCKANPGKFTEF